MKKLSSRQLQAQQTRQKIIDASYDVFLQNGFQKTTITQIIQKAHIGYGTAYVYFKNKDEIFIEIMENVMKKFYEVAEIPFSPQTKEEARQLIEHQVRLFLQLAIQEQQMLQIMKEAIGISAVVEKKWKAIREQFINRIAKDVAYSQTKGLARPYLQPNLVARGWFYANEMYMWELTEQDVPFSLDEAVYHLTEMYTNGVYC
ncbi:TetR/AcrR family transcriptional regulator [Anoxybacteroides tepidamans]|uniref:TetR/AcrR family transcriptional regulator n=1 Tax=Anoxybacteroides tepidamans TaxID=265948 RepID=UPI0004814B33|nr:TetR/AcrR family transcriptional regulator [Anoxybacillus tepidamans]